MTSKLDEIVTKHYGIVQLKDYELADSLIEALKGGIKKSETMPEYSKYDVYYELDQAYANMKKREIK